jgi:translocation and assembly module TamB
MRSWLALPFCLLPLTAIADTAADKDFLTTWLQENLSGTGRTVTIDGFQGALSSQASLKQLTIADGQGVWLTLKDVTLDWSRSALLTGNIRIDQLSAGEIDFERVPTADATSAVPQRHCGAQDRSGPDGPRPALGGEPDRRPDACQR